MQKARTIRATYGIALFLARAGSSRRIAEAVLVMVRRFW